MLLLFVVVVSVGIGLTVEAFNRIAQGILEQARTSPTQEVTRTPKKARRYAAQTKRTPCGNDKSGAVVPYLAVSAMDAHSGGISHCDSGGVDAGGDCGGSL